MQRPGEGPGKLVLIRLCSGLGQGSLPAPSRQPPVILGCQEGPSTHRALFAIQRTLPLRKTQRMDGAVHDPLCPAPAVLTQPLQILHSFPQETRYFLEYLFYLFVCLFACFYIILKIIIISKQRKRQNAAFICNAETEGLPQLQLELGPTSPLVTAEGMLEKS